MSLMNEARRIMELAAQYEGTIRYRLPSWGKAVNFRMNCYRFRKQHQQAVLASLGHIPGLEAPTPFDNINIVIEDSAGNRWDAHRPPDHKNEPYDLVFLKDLNTGELLDEHGQPLSPPQPESLL